MDNIFSYTGEGVPATLDEMFILFHPEDKIISEKIINFSKDILRPDIPDEAMLYLLTMDRMAYCKTIFHTNATLYHALEEMKTFEIKDIKQLSGVERNKYLIGLILLYRKSCFSRDKMVVDFFRKVGFSEDNMNWLFDIKVIISELDKIREGGKAVMFSGSALTCILGYLQYRATNEVFLWAGDYVDNYDGIKYSNNIFIKGKNYLRYNHKLDMDFIEINWSLEELEKSFENVNYKKMALAFLKGDTSKIYLQAIISLCYSATIVKSKNIFFAEFYDLFKLLVGQPSTVGSNNFLPNEKEYGKGRPISYKTYKGKRIKELYWKDESLRFIEPEK